MNEKKEKFEDYVKRGIIPITEDIGPELRDLVQAGLSDLYLDRVEHILVIFSSDGGDADVCLEIHDYIKSYPGHVTGLVVGRAFSAAAIVLQACHKRYATRNSRVLIHHGTVGVETDTMFNKKQLKELVRSLANQETYFYEILHQRTRKSIEEVKKQCERDEEMLITEAIDFGLLDAVWTGPVPWEPVEHLRTLYTDENQDEVIHNPNE